MISPTIQASRGIAVIALLVLGVMMLRITWRNGALKRFDFYGNPTPMSRWQLMTRYLTGVAWLFLAYIQVNSLLLQVPGGARTTVFSVIIAGLSAASVGWHHETRPRPFFRPLWAVIVRQHPIMRMVRRHP